MSFANVAKFRSCCREIKTTLKGLPPTEAEDVRNLSHTVSKAIASLRDCPCRVHNTATLRRLAHFGPVLVKLVDSVLWKLYPPDEADSEDDEAWNQLGREEKERKVCCTLSQ